MKKFCLLFLTILPVLSAFSKPAPAPKWLDDPREVFPESEYIVQKVSGKTAEESKNNAASAMSQYFKTTVDGRLSTRLASRSSADGAEENLTVLEEITVESHNDFFALEYAGPYYHKPEKKWHCLVYINRNRAWNQYKPYLDVYVNAFNNLYETLVKENSLEKLKACHQVMQSGRELLEKLEYGRILNPREEKNYHSERERIASIPAIYEEAKSNSSIYINATSGCSPAIVSAVRKSLAECAFPLCSNRTEAACILDIAIDDNINGDNPFAIKPSLTITITYAVDNHVLSIALESGEQTLSYTLENARKKAYPKLCKMISDYMQKEFSLDF